MSNAIYGQSAELIRFAKVLADESAQIIRRYFRADYQVEMKSDATPVTIADRRAEEVMRTLIGREFPEHGVLGEEFGQTNPDAEFQWVLDPIDGTKSFVAGSFLFGTLIALVQNGRPILGVINQPLLNDFLVGDGAGCWLNERPLKLCLLNQCLLNQCWLNQCWLKLCLLNQCSLNQLRSTPDALAPPPRRGPVARWSPGRSPGHR